MPVEILIDENGTIDALVSVESAEVEIIATLSRRRDTLTLEGVHVELIEGGPLDRRAIGLLCTELGRHYQVGLVVVRGARRTTGRFAGKIPRAIKHQVPK